MTGDAKTADVGYSTFEQAARSGVETGAVVPWTKTVEATGLFIGAFTVTTGEEGGSVTCKVVVDGKEVKTATAAGEFAVASCTGF